MKQDQAEAKAVANALPYGLRMLPVRDVPQLQCLAPDFEIATRKPSRPAPIVPPLKNQGVTVEEAKAMLDGLRDEFAKKASGGLYRDAADAEWRGLPIEMRECLLRVAGVRAKSKPELHSLASRAWQEMPDTEREAIKRVVRLFKRYVLPLSALAAKV